MNKIIVISFFLLFSSFSFACSCIGKSSMKKELKHTDVVFTGKIISQRIYEEKDSLFINYPDNFIPRKVEYRILVIEKLKGEIKTDTITVFTGFGNGDCGVKFNIGEEYILYSNYEDEHFNTGKKVEKFLTTNICTRTQRFEKKEFAKIKRYAKRKGYC